MNKELDYAGQKKALQALLALQRGISLKEAESEIEDAMDRFYEKGFIEVVAFHDGDEPTYELRVNHASRHKCVSARELQAVSDISDISDKETVSAFLNTPAGRQWTIETRELF